MPTSGFRVETRQVGDEAYVVSLAGELDFYTAPAFKEALLEVISRGGTQLVVDLTEVTFIDSTALSVLVGARKRLLPRGGDVVLVCSDRNVINVFRATGLDREFLVYASLDEGIAHLGLDIDPEAA